MAAAVPTPPDTRSQADEWLDRGADPLLSLALEAANTGLWTWDVCSDRVRWSPETYRIHGVTPHNFCGTGQGFFALVHREDRARVQHTVLAAAREHRPYACEFRIVRPDGSIRHVTNRGRAHYDSHGTWCAVLGTITDVTDYTTHVPSAPKAANAASFNSCRFVAADSVTTADSDLEEERLRAQAQLAYHARIFRDLIEGNPFGVYVVDANFRLSHVSKGVRETGGSPPWRGEVPISSVPSIGRADAWINHL